MKIRQADFARMVGVQRTAINNLTKRGTLEVDINGFIDTEHKKTRKYIRYRKEKGANGDFKTLNKLKSQEKQQKPKGYVLKKAKTNAIAGLYEDYDGPEEPISYQPKEKPIDHKQFGIDIEQKTLTDTKKLIEDYGPAIAKQVMETERLKADASLKKIMLKEKRGDLISREKIAHFLLLYLNILNKKILDFPAQTIDRIIALCETQKDPKQEIIDLILSNLSMYIKDTKQEITRRVSQSWRAPIPEQELKEDYE